MDNQIESLVAKVRSEKDPFVKARLIKSLIRDHDLRLYRLAKMISLKPSYICHYLRLNRLPEIVIDGYYNKDISISHLFIISRLKNIEDISTVYEKVLGKNLSVLATEELIRNILYGIKSEGKTLSPEERETYLNYFQGKAKLKIIQTRIKSKLEIEIKGSLVKTTKVLRSILDRLKDF